jgi:hypothetical protein
VAEHFGSVPRGHSAVARAWGDSTYNEDERSSGRVHQHFTSVHLMVRAARPGELLGLSLAPDSSTLFNLPMAAQRIGPKSPQRTGPTPPPEQPRQAANPSQAPGPNQSAPRSALPVPEQREPQRSRSVTVTVTITITVPEQRERCQRDPTHIDSNPARLGPARGPQTLYGHHGRRYRTLLAFFPCNI